MLTELYENAMEKCEKDVFGEMRRLFTLHVEGLADIQDYSNEFSILYGPTVSGAVGREESTRWYKYFVNEPTRNGTLHKRHVISSCCSSLLGNTQCVLVEEALYDFEFMHGKEMHLEWLVPGIKLKKDFTAKVSAILISFYTFNVEKKVLFDSLRVYWDQGCILQQLGLLKINCDRLGELGLKSNYILPLSESDPEDALGVIGKAVKKENLDLMKQPKIPIDDIGKADEQKKIQIHPALKNWGIEKTSEVSSSFGEKENVLLNNFAKLETKKSIITENKITNTSSHDEASSNRKLQNLSHVFDDCPHPVNSFSGILINQKNLSLKNFVKNDLESTELHSSLKYNINRRDMQTQVFDVIKPLSKDETSLEKNDLLNTRKSYGRQNTMKSSVFSTNESVVENHNETRNKGNNLDAMAWRQRNQNSRVFDGQVDKKNDSVSRDLLPHEISVVFDSIPPESKKRGAGEFQPKCHILLGDDGGETGLVPKVNVGDKNEKNTFPAGVSQGKGRKSFGGGPTTIRFF